MRRTILLAVVCVSLAVPFGAAAADERPLVVAQGTDIERRTIPGPSSQEKQQMPPTQSWSEYRPPGVGFRLEMPAQWQTSSQDVPTDLGKIAMHMATVDMGTKAYMAIHSTFPQSHIDRTPAELLLDNARDGAVKNVKGTLLSEQKIKLGGYPGRHIVVNTKDNRIAQRFVLYGNKLIQAIYVGAAGEETQPNAVRFFNSFAVVQP